MSTAGAIDYSRSTLTARATKTVFVPKPSGMTPAVGIMRLEQASVERRREHDVRRDEANETIGPVEMLSAKHSTIFDGADPRLRAGGEMCTSIQRCRRAVRRYSVLERRASA